MRPLDLTLQLISATTYQSKQKTKQNEKIAMMSMNSEDKI